MHSIVPNQVLNTSTLYPTLTSTNSAFSESSRQQTSLDAGHVNNSKVGYAYIAPGPKIFFKSLVTVFGDLHVKLLAIS